MTQMVIIGGGQAAGQAVASLRQEGFDGKIVLIGEESTLPYQRPPLSKAYLSGAVAAENSWFGLKSSMKTETLTFILARR